MVKRRAEKVFVAMSGGVDSSVAAALLKGAGYDVRGVFMQGWRDPNFECTWAQDRRDAARVAAVLGIPFETADFSKAYCDLVVSYLVDEYKSGRTPNPDVMCNKKIKFGLFLDWALARGADYIATGHYARKHKVKSEKREIVNYVLAEARDQNKDQSYFLWTLTQGQLAKCLFPIGEYIKPEVRQLARKHRLPTADKKDSQGICFLGKGKISDFLKSSIEVKKGLVKTVSGECVGTHDGVEFLTIGQRHGIGIGGGKPYYVAQKKMATNTLIVASDSENKVLYNNVVKYDDANWIGREAFPIKCSARIRYRQPLEKCIAYKGYAVFNKPQRAVAPGQSIVFYKRNKVLGGGIIRG